VTDIYDDEPDPLRRLGIYLELAEAPHVERALAAVVSLRGTEHHEAARHAWHVIRALEARAERAEALAVPEVQALVEALERDGVAVPGLVAALVKARARLRNGGAGSEGPET